MEYFKIKTKEEVSTENLIQYMPRHLFSKIKECNVSSYSAMMNRCVNAY